MARIPLGNFGNVMPQVQQTPIQQNTRGAIAGAVTNAALQVAQQESNRAKQEQLVLDRQQEQESKIKFANLGAKATADLSLLDDNLNNQISQGLGINEAALQRQEGIELIKNQYQFDVPEKYKLNFASYIDTSAYESSAKLMPAFRNAQQQQNVVLVDDTIDSALKAPDKSQFKALVQTSLDGSNLPSATQQQKYGKALNDWDTNQATREVEALYLNGDIEGLKTSFSTESLNKNYPDLQAGQITALQKTASGKIRQIESANATELKAKDNDAKDALSEIKGIVNSGGVPDPKLIQGLYGRVQGTTYEKEAANFVNASDEIGNFLRLPPDQRATLLSRMESNQKNRPSDDPVFDAWKLQQMESAHGEALTREKNDPTGNFSIATGKDIVNPPATAIVVGDQQAIGALSSNIKQLAAFNSSRGITGSDNPLTRQTQGELKSFWAKAPAEQRLNLLQTFLTSSKGYPSAYKSMVDSIGGTSDSYRLAASIANRGGYNHVATRIVKGQMLLEQKKVNFSTSEADTATTEYLDGIYRNGTAQYNIYRDSARAYYAELLQQSEAKKDDKGKYAFDKELYSDALIAVTGGRYIQDNWFGVSNSVLRPYGVTDKSFRDQLDSFNSLNSRNYGTDRDYFKNLKMVQDQKTPNRYYFMDGTKPVRTANNQDILFMTIR